MNSFPEHDLQELVKEIESDLNHELVVFNDDVNSFEHVIDTLIDVCDHEPEQAEQCTWIIHHNGKCSVKKGDIEGLNKMCQVIHDRGISASVN